MFGGLAVAFVCGQFVFSFSETCLQDFSQRSQAVAPISAFVRLSKTVCPTDPAWDARAPDNNVGLGVYQLKLLRKIEHLALW